MQHKSDFHDTVARFQEFLGNCAYSRRIVWVMPEDVLVSGKRFVYVRFPVPGTNEAKIRQIYADGMVSRRGLLMATVCEMDDSTCCFLWHPKNDGEKPQGIWPQDGSVKMSANSIKIRGKAIRNRLLWKILALRYREKQESKPLLFS